MVFFHGRRDARYIIVAMVCVLVPVSYVELGLATKRYREAAFAATGIGDTYDQVVSRFGAPSTIDGYGKDFSRYASEQCRSPCEKRLWFENRLFLDIEAWSVSFDRGDRVIDKYHWVSP